MKIDSPCDDKIIVELSARDMEELDISFEEMDYSNIETRRVIWTLLDRAGRELGRDIDPCGRLLIEAAKSPCGGCVLCFTVSAEKKNVMRRGGGLVREKNELIYEFEDVCALTDCCRAVSFLADEVEESELYSQDGKYRIVLRLVSGAGGAKIPLSEYGRLVGSGSFAAGITREHWKRIADHGAVSRVGRY